MDGQAMFEIRLYAAKVANLSESFDFEDSGMEPDLAQALEAAGAAAGAILKHLDAEFEFSNAAGPAVLLPRESDL